MIVFLFLTIVFVLALFGVLEIVDKIFGRGTVAQLFINVFELCRVLIKGALSVAALAGIFMLVGTAIVCPPLIWLYAFTGFCIWVFYAIRKTYR